MENKRYYPPHLISHAPWPSLCVMVTNTTVLGLLSYVSSSTGMNLFFLCTNFTILLSLIGLWFKDVIVERTYEDTYEGPHDDTRDAIHERHVQIGIVLFIISEIIFFFTLFGAFFHLNLSPADMLYWCCLKFCL